MCDVCEQYFGHLDGCPLDYGCGDGGDIEHNLTCSICGETISTGECYIYDPDGDGDGIVCSGCIEELSVSDILDICGVSTVAEIISEIAGKVMKAGDRY